MWIAMDIKKDSSTSSSSSSIGKNSELSEQEDHKETDASDEAQSNFNGAPFHSLQALELLLPIRRGISSFYSGKSKSFACLSASTLPSSKHITKPDNAYNRRRRNLIASAAHVWDHLHKTSSPTILKRPFMHSSRSTHALGLAMSSSSSSSSSEHSNCSRSGSFSHLPPLHPN